MCAIDQAQQACPVGSGVLACLRLTTRSTKQHFHTPGWALAMKAFDRQFDSRCLVMRSQVAGQGNGCWALFYTFAAKYSTSITRAVQILVLAPRHKPPCYRHTLKHLRPSRLEVTPCL